MSLALREGEEFASSLRGFPTGLQNPALPRRRIGGCPAVGFHPLHRWRRVPVFRALIRDCLRHDLVMGSSTAAWQSYPCK